MGQIVAIKKRENKRIVIQKMNEISKNYHAYDDDERSPTKLDFGAAGLESIDEAHGECRVSGCVLCHVSGPIFRRLFCSSFER